MHYKIHSKIINYIGIIINFNIINFKIIYYKIANFKIIIATMLKNKVSSANY